MSRGSIRRVRVAVPLEECKRRALAYLISQKHKGLVKASCVAGEIWPEAVFHAQGGGAAASRILKHLERDGKARWTLTSSDWGWKAV